MKSSTLTILLFVVVFCFLNKEVFAQVGINTTTPNLNVSLDINGRVMIQDLSRTAENLTGVKMILSEADGTLIEATLPSNLITKDETTHQISMIEKSNTTEKIELLFEASGSKNNWDLGLDAVNSDVTIFIIRSSGNLTIRGIQGGIEGRKIRIINDSSFKIKFNDEDSNSSNIGNRYYNYSGFNEMNKYGSCLLVYSSEISTNGHWNIVQMSSD
jgi:hypothetical protein